MKITTNMDVNRQAGVAYTVDNKIVNREEKTTTSEKVAELSLSEESGRKAVMTDDELQCAIENVLASQGSVYDIQQAEQMISEVNRKILENASESVLAQANQTPQMVAELTQ